MGLNNVAENVVEEFSDIFGVEKRILNIELSNEDWIKLANSGDEKFNFFIASKMPKELVLKINQNRMEEILKIIKKFNLKISSKEANEWIIHGNLEMRLFAVPFAYKK